MPDATATREESVSLFLTNSPGPGGWMFGFGIKMGIVLVRCGTERHRSNKLGLLNLIEVLIHRAASWDKNHPKKLGMGGARLL